MAERLFRDLVSAFSAIFNSTNSLIRIITFLDTNNSTLATLVNEDEDEMFADFIKVVEAFNLTCMTLLHNGNQPEPPRQRYLLFPDFLSSQFPGRDLLSELIIRPWLLYDMTGETVESFTSIVRDVTPIVEALNMQGEERDRISYTKLTTPNRILLVFIWLRKYQTLSELSTLFLVSPSVIQRNIALIVPILSQYFLNYIRWPTDEEWRRKIGQWNSFPEAVAIIDGTLHEVYRPMTDPQELYYSGRVKYHCFSTQIIVDNTGHIVFVQCGFLGHQNDAGQWQHIAPPIGPGMPNSLPDNTYILADRGYPNEEPLLTPWRRQRLNGHPDRRFFNQELASCRQIVEHSIARFKEYRIISTLYRHRREDAQRVMELCAALAERHIRLSRAIR